MHEPLPIVLGDNVVYALPLDGGGVLLVDAGPDADGVDGARDGPGGEHDGATWTLLLRQARAHGFGAAEVRAVVITHAHVDHAGLAARWADAGARILVGAADVAAVTAGAAANEAQRTARLAELARQGCPAEMVAQLGARRAGRTLRWAPCPARAVEPVEAERGIPLAGGRALRLLPSPGHTPGNLVGFIDATGDLFSGDTLLPTTIPTAGLHFPAVIAAAAALAGEPTATGLDDGDPSPRWPSLPPFLRAVDALRALPVRRVLPGHGGVVDDPGPLFARFSAHHERRARRIHAALAEGSTTAYALARGMFPRLPAPRLAQAVTEVLGHLDVLAERGEAAAQQRDGVVTWLPTRSG